MALISAFLAGAGVYLMVAGLVTAAGGAGTLLVAYLFDDGSDE